MPLHLFCQNKDCRAYLAPNANECHKCGQARDPQHILPAPNQSYWSTKLPGELACPPLWWKDQLLVAWKNKSEGGLCWLNFYDGKAQGESRRVSKPILHLEVLPNETALLTLGNDGNAGGGSLAAVDLNSRQILWQRDLPGVVSHGAYLESQRAYVACGDGLLYCLDASNKGETIWTQRYMDRKAAAPRLLVPYRQNSVVVGTPDYEGRILLVSRDGVTELCQFSQRIKGGWRTADHLYVLLDQDVCLMQLSNRAQKNLYHGKPGAALESNGVLYVGDLDHFVRALDKNGKQLWQFRTEGGVTTLLRRDDLLYVGDTHGKVYLLASADGAEVGRVAVGINERDGVASRLQLVEERLLVGARSGSLCSFPWHLGQYESVARRLAKPDAAAFYCVAAEFAPQNEKKNDLRERASTSWVDSGMYDEAARMWEAAGELRRAAKLYEEAAHSVSGVRPKDGVRYRLRAMNLWDELFWGGDHEAETKRDHQIDRLKQIPGVRIPLLKALLINAPKYIERGTGEFMIQLKNVGLISAKEITLLISGGLVSTPEIKNFKDILPYAEATYTFSITPTKSGEMRLEFTYRDYSYEYPKLTASLTFPIEVKESLVLQTGDIGLLKLTSENVVVYGQDIGAIMAQGETVQAHAAGDMGNLIRRCVKCSSACSPQAKFCANCGSELK